MFLRFVTWYESGIQKIIFKNVFSIYYAWKTYQVKMYGFEETNFARKNERLKQIIGYKNLCSDGHLKGD